MMTYKEISKACEKLSYKNKIRLAQRMMELARNEKEEQDGFLDNVNQEEKSIEYIANRLLKLKPAKKKTLLNAINSMFQCKGGISEEEKEKVIQELEQHKYLKIEQNNRVTYLPKILTPKKKKK